WRVTSPKGVDDLLSAPLLSLRAEPMTAQEVADYLSGDGLELTVSRAGDLLARLETLGLARVTGCAGTEARYVATSLGQRAAAALVTADPEVRLGLEELERLRGDLLATVGHELR